jgi:DNA polymerase-3 subunit gamma/tau
VHDLFRSTWGAHGEVRHEGKAGVSYEVLARRMRPQQFEEVVGQDAISRTLKNSLTKNRVAHAFLFSGMRGVGKTTTARILAKALNCIKGPAPEPCSACPSCLEIAGGTSMDVLEIDGASNRGIDQIRELRENVKYAPARDRYKIFIIDEVHMLTQEAFNALLKTLEEPPAHVIFILATTELHKVPGTIVSRCQQFEFRRIPNQEIEERLRMICKGDGIGISDKSLALITRASEGSLRDAESILDQVISFSGQEVTDEDVRQLLGLVNEDALLDLSAAIIDQDSARVLALVSDVTEKGYQPRQFCVALMEHFRNVLICKVSPDPARLLPFSDEFIAKLKSSAERLSEEDLYRYFQILSQGESELKRAEYPRYHLEMTLLKLAQLKRLTSIETLLERISRITGAAEPCDGPQADETPRRPAPRASESRRKDEPPEHKAARRTHRKGPASEAAPSSPAPPPAGEDFEMPEDAGEPGGSPARDAAPDRTGSADFLGQIQKKRASLAGLLGADAGIEIGPETLRIVLPVSRRGLTHILQERENLGFLEKTAHEMLGRKVRIEITHTGAESGPVEKPAAGQSKQAEEERERASRDPDVQAVLEIFGGHVADARKPE